MKEPISINLAKKDVINRLIWKNEYTIPKIPEIHIVQ